MNALSLINIQPDSVRQSAAQIGSIMSLLQREVLLLHNIGSGTSDRVLQRRDLYTRITRVINDLNELMNELRALETTLKHAMDRYRDAEESIKRLAEEMLDVKNNAFVDVFNNTTGVAGMLSEIIGRIDNVLIYTQSTMIGSTALFGRLKINYVSGKPTLMQRIKGDYKFTISAPKSWTKQRGKYSSVVAHKFDAFVKSSPTNPLMKKLHQFASTYRAPSDILKHAAGFIKNRRVSVSGEDFYKAYTKRATTGVFDHIETVAKNKGFRAFKSIPVIDRMITLVSNLGEYKDTTKGDFEKTGRFLGGLLTDLGSTAIGAKAGAVIGGMIGGPIGVVVGGAIGGAAGAFVGSKFADDAKNFGGWAAKKVEVAGQAFKSLPTWFS